MVESLSWEEHYNNYATNVMRDLCSGEYRTFTASKTTRIYHILCTFFLSTSIFISLSWSSAPPQCKPLSCGYPHVEDPHALVEKSSYKIQRSQGAGIGDEASIACQAGFQMVISNSSGRGGGKALMEVVDRIKVICNKEGMWEKPFHYYCHNATTTKVRSNCLNAES